MKGKRVSSGTREIISSKKNKRTSNNEIQGASQVSNEESEPTVLLTIKTLIYYWRTTRRTKIIPRFTISGPVICIDEI